MASEQERTWTAEEIKAIFEAEERLAESANRKATRSHSNPFGDSYDSLVWFGSIEEAWESRQQAARLASQVNALREKATPEGEEFEEIETVADWEANRAEIEEAVLSLADHFSRIGSGRPIFLATFDGDFVAVFCEVMTAQAVRSTVESFYDPAYQGGDAAG